jgi:hypothetical protein
VQCERRVQQLADALLQLLLLLLLLPCRTQLVRLLVLGQELQLVLVLSYALLALAGHRQGHCCCCWCRVGYMQLLKYPADLTSPPLAAAAAAAEDCWKFLLLLLVAAACGCLYQRTEPVPCQAPAAPVTSTEGQTHRYYLRCCGCHPLHMLPAPCLAVAAACLLLLLQLDVRCSCLQRKLPCEGSRLSVCCCGLLHHLRLLQALQAALLLPLQQSHLQHC